IDVRRYIVDYNGKKYYINFAQYGKGYANAWLGDDFENNYLKKQGSAFTFELTYADENQSAYVSNVSTALNIQNVASEATIPTEGANEDEMGSSQLAKANGKNSEIEEAKTPKTNTNKQVTTANNGNVGAAAANAAVTANSRK